MAADRDMVEEEDTLGVNSPDVEARGVTVEEFKGVTVGAADAVIQLAVMEVDRVGVTEEVVEGVVVPELCELTEGGLVVVTETQKDRLGVKVPLTLQDRDPEGVRVP